MASTDDVTQLSGNPVVDEAMKRFKRTAEWESTWRSRFIEDIKFADGDSDNQWQWPNDIKRTRDIDKRPCLTLNLIRQHNLQILNDSKKNKLGVTVRPVGNGATKESSDVLKGLIRHIEYQSRAQSAYSTARGFQVKGGLGWFRLVTDYVSPDSMDQEIFIRRIWDPLSVYLDPDIQEEDGSDAKFGFVFDIVPKEEFEEAYPQFADKATLSPLGMGTVTNDMIPEDHVGICEYFRVVKKADRLFSFIDPASRQRKTVRESKLHPSMVKAVASHPLTKIRHVQDKVVEWYLIVAEQVLDETVWPGTYIPLIRVIGEETVVDGQLDRKGHTRTMKDSQRMLNYNASSQVEFVALQGKTPWVGPAAAIEELETYWASANNTNHSFLPFKHVDDEGNPIPSPQRTQPPTASPAYQQGMDTAFNHLMMVSGQWQNQMGMQGNERTGAAIQKRMDQGDTATYHFQDSFCQSLVNCGRQIIELIPKVYDTARVIKILADDGVDQEVSIDPSARQAYLQQVDRDNKVVKRVFNPTLGLYDVEAAAGPAYGTKREQTVEALTLILTQNPALTSIVGDLLLQAMDFDEAQEAAQRLKRMVPPQALGSGPTQQEQQLTQQVQLLTSSLSKSLSELGMAKIKLKGKEELRDIDVYQKETDRLKVLLDKMPEGGSGLTEVVQQLITEMLSTTLKPVTDANEESLDDATPGEGVDKSNTSARSGAGRGNVASEAEDAKEAGVGGDTELVHLNKRELGVVMRALGRRPKPNPKTGLPSFSEGDGGGGDGSSGGDAYGGGDSGMSSYGGGDGSSGGDPYGGGDSGMSFEQAMANGVFDAPPATVDTPAPAPALTVSKGGIGSDSTLSAKAGVPGNFGQTFPPGAAPIFQGGDLGAKIGNFAADMAGLKGNINTETGKTDASLTINPLNIAASLAGGPFAGLAVRGLEALTGMSDPSQFTMNFGSGARDDGSSLVTAQAGESPMANGGGADGVTARPSVQQVLPQGGEVPPVPGARKAADGNWYVPDPTRPGKWLRVLPQGQG